MKSLGGRDWSDIVGGRWLVVRGEVAWMKDGVMLPSSSPAVSSTNLPHSETTEKRKCDASEYM